MIGRRPRAAPGLKAIAALLLAGLVLLAQPPAAAQTGLLQGELLLDAMRQGGFNIYFRHASTNWSQSDDVTERDDWLSCDATRMRQLSADGRADSTAIGTAMRRLEIPVNQVIASPYCRTMETARLMALGPVTPSIEVMNLRVARFFGGREAIVASARRLLATVPMEGGNRVIVAHGNVARESTPYYPGEGEGLVFKPDDAGGFRLVGRITPAAWAELLMRYNP